MTERPWRHVRNVRAPTRIAQRHKGAGRYMLLERELVEQRTLFDSSLTHHLCHSSLNIRSESATQRRGNPKVFQRNLPIADISTKYPRPRSVPCPGSHRLKYSVLVSTDALPFADRPTSGTARSARRKS